MIRTYSPKPKGTEKSQPQYRVKLSNQVNFQNAPKGAGNPQLTALPAACPHPTPQSQAQCSKVIKMCPSRLPGTGTGPRWQLHSESLTPPHRSSEPLLVSAALLPLHPNLYVLCPPRHLSLVRPTAPFFLQEHLCWVQLLDLPHTNRDKLSMST